MNRSELTSLDRARTRAEEDNAARAKKAERRLARQQRAADRRARFGPAGKPSPVTVRTINEEAA